MNNKEMFIKLIEVERERQQKAWPNQDLQRNVSLHQWNTILTEELGEFAKEVNDKRDLEALIELAETAAVCLKIAETYFHPILLQKALGIMSERALNQKVKQ